MTTPDQIREDLQFLVGAVERQRRLQRALIGPTTACIWAAFVLVTAVVNSPALWEYTARWAGRLSQGAFILAIIGTVVGPWYDLKRRGEIVEYTWRDVGRILLPWAGCAAAVFLFYPVARVEDMAAGRRFYVAAVMVALTAYQVGLAGSLVMLGVGMGAGMGLLILWVLPSLGPIGLAVPFLVGLVGGAFFENRRARR